MNRRHTAVVLCAVLFASVAHAGLTAEQKCQQAKWKAQAKVEACLKKNSAKLVGGSADAAAKCWTKFQAGLAKADAKAAAAAASCRFVDNGDGTVGDLNTGLLWEQKTSADGAANPADPHDADNLYTLSVSGTGLDGTAYTSFLAALDGGASTDGGAGTPITGCFAGYCDWRLPSIVELQAIVDPAACGVATCLDAAFGPRPSYAYYWSASAVGADPTSAWDIKFSGSGEIYPYGKTNGDWVRAVRGGLSVPPSAASLVTPTRAPTAVPTATPTAPIATPTQTPKLAGAACSANNQCSSGYCGAFGTGHCCGAACSVGGICGATDCGAAGQCSYPSTVTLASSAPGDCQDVFCNGIGGTTSVDAPTDLPTSATVCQIPACSGPSPLHPTFTAAAAGTDCSADNQLPKHVCGSGISAGVCVQCNGDGDCSGGQTCHSNVCS